MDVSRRLFPELITPDLEMATTGEGDPPHSIANEGEFVKSGNIDSKTPDLKLGSALKVDAALVPPGKEGQTPCVYCLPDLHVDVHTHTFFTGDTSSVKGIGNLLLCAKWFSDIGDEVKQNITRAGFGEFVKILDTCRPDNMLLHALSERWWDSTHTFHFDNIGELTMTPTDFSAISGLPVSGKPIWFDIEAAEKRECIKLLFGNEMLRMVVQEDQKTCTDLYEEYLDFPRTTAKEIDQLTRVFLLALIGSVLCTNGSGQVNLQMMHCLENIDEISLYNWGGAGLASMYKNMDAMSRSAVPTGCIWKLWELWARQYVIPLGRGPSFGLVSWPRGCDNLKNLSPRNGVVDIASMDYQKLLRHLTTEQLNLHPWGILENEVPDYVKKSMPMSSKRVLLKCPTGYCWYLGERVTRQDALCSYPRVPVDPPPTMLGNYQFTDEEVEEWMRGTEADLLTGQTELSYEEFTDKYIKYHDYPTRSVQEDKPEEIVQVSEIRMPPWKVNVVEICDELMYRAIEVPRNVASPYLPLLENVKAVSAETATTLIRHIAGLASVATTQSMKAKEEWSKIKMQGELSLKAAKCETDLLRAELVVAQNEINELRSVLESIRLSSSKPHLSNNQIHSKQASFGAASTGYCPGSARRSNVVWRPDVLSRNHQAVFPQMEPDSGDVEDGAASQSDEDDAWELTAPSKWHEKPTEDMHIDVKRPRNN